MVKVWVQQSIVDCQCSMINFVATVSFLVKNPTGMFCGRDRRRKNGERLLRVSHSIHHATSRLLKKHIWLCSRSHRVLDVASSYAIGRTACCGLVKYTFWTICQSLNKNKFRNVEKAHLTLFSQSSRPRRSFQLRHRPHCLLRPRQIYFLNNLPIIE